MLTKPLARIVPLALALSVLVARDARAQSALERETARTLLLSGREKRKSGHHQEALADFERAHSIMHVPTTALDLGKEQMTLGLLVEAHATFLEAVHHPHKANEPRAFGRARREAKTLAEELGPRLANLTIVVSPAGAAVKLDASEISESMHGVSLKVNPGKHVVVASLGESEKQTSVELAPGEAKTVELAIEPATPPPATVKSEPSIPPRPLSSPPTIMTRTNALVWVGLGVAAVGSIVGGTTGILSFAAADDVSARCAGSRCPPSTHDDIDRGERLGTISNIAFAVAGVGVIVLVYGLLTPSKIKTEPRSIARSGLRVTF